MENPIATVYSGKVRTLGYSDYILENNLFFVLEIEDGMDQVQGKEIIHKIKEEYSNYAIQNLASLDQFISHLVTKYNLPSSFSIALGYAKDNILYLKTAGQGRIYIKRNGNFAQIIAGDKSASGYIKENDFYIFTTGKFIDELGPDADLKKMIEGKSPDEVAESLQLILKDKENEGVIALFSEYLPEIKEEAIEGEKFVSPMVKTDKGFFLDNLKNKGRTFLDKLQELSEKSGKKKLFTLVAVVIIFLILVWSVGLGYHRRNIAENNRKISQVRDSVNQKIKQAEDSAFLNLNRSMNLLSDAKQQVETLKQEIGSDNKDIEELENSVKAAEGRIIKKEEKNYEEFFDLTLDSKGAKGTKLFLTGESLKIVDPGKRTVYLLSLSKKSLDKHTSSELKDTGLVAAHQDYLIFYTDGQGVYKLTPNNKANKVIDKDKDWGKIQEMWIFNGNLYLLDSIKGDIYKYLVTENGYSEKSSYLGGGAGEIKEANSLAIDSSVYIGFEDKVVKYTSGIKDDFSTSWPDKEISLTKVFTNEDLKKVYVWSKDKGAIYILNKNGTYERQINSSILSKASDFVVYEESAYVLVGEKIHSIELD